jgi:NAD-dependent dihydropyrimidine dehydrogenase PreA subunit
MATIQENSYCFVDYDTDPEGIVRHMCLECHETHPMGWFWPGKDPQVGYGANNIACWFCNKLIFQNEETETDL